MPFSTKNLDDRRFKDLFEEAKRRIPAYLEEWTDHNDSDPGIAVAQLFAWLTETMLFRLNQVPDERMYVAFLNLIGRSPRPALPAQAPVQFQLRPGVGGRTFIGHELRLTAAGDAGDLFFEPPGEVPLIGATLGKVLVDDGVSLERLDVTLENEKRTEPYAPFGTSRVRDRAIYLGFDTDVVGGVPLPIIPGPDAQLQLVVRVDDKALPLEPASTSLSPGVTSLESDLTWEGFTARGWERLDTADDTRGLKKNGFLRLTLTGQLIAAKERGDEDQLDRFWIRARASAANAPETRRIHYLAPNAAVVGQWRTFAQELLLPGSNGEAKQERTVRYPPILKDPRFETVVEVKEPAPSGNLEWVAWTESEDDHAPAANDDGPPRFFSISPDRTRVVFGDGTKRRIPPRGVNNLRITYRNGGGKAGNVALGAMQLSSNPPDLLDATQLEKAEGGEDEQAIDEARREAPVAVKALERAVTAQDFISLALSKTNAKRAIALNRHHPRYPAVPVTGAITLVVLPDAELDDHAPLPTQQFLDEVARRLEEFRVLTTELFVIAPRYQKIDVDVEVELRRGADPAAVKEAIIADLHRLFHPLFGGADGSGWPLGETISYGLVLSRVQNVEGVAFVRSVDLTLDGAKKARCEDVPLASKITLLESGDHDARTKGTRD